MCRAVSMGARSCGLTRWNAGYLPNDEVMRCAMLKCHHTSRRTATWGELLALQSSEGDDQLDYNSSWKINEACLRFASQNGLEVTFQKRCADVQLPLAISSQLPSTLKRITLPNFPTNFPALKIFWGHRQKDDVLASQTGSAHAKWGATGFHGLPRFSRFTAVSPKPGRVRSSFPAPWWWFQW